MIYLLRKGNLFTVEWRKIRFHRDMLSEIVRYGLPSGVQNSVIAFANVIVQSQINSFGKLAMAAYGTHAKIEGFAFLPITSFNMASTTFISQNLGARQYDRAKKGSRFSIPRLPFGITPLQPRQTRHPSGIRQETVSPAQCSAMMRKSGNTAVSGCPRAR